MPVMGGLRSRVSVGTAITGELLQANLCKLAKPSMARDLQGRPLGTLHRLGSYSRNCVTGNSIVRGNMGNNPATRLQR
jgi:hypothetical protein